VERVAQLTVLGSLNMDISVMVPVLPTPGATVLGGAASFAPGGKGANQAVAAARLGVTAGIHVGMVGCVGDDDFGRTLRAALRAEGVDSTGLRTVPGVPTGIAMITVDAEGENIITVAPGANHRVGDAEVAASGEASDMLVISAEIPVPVIKAALANTGPADAGRRPSTLLNLAPAPSGGEAADLVAVGPDWLVVNESEAAVILARPVAGLRDAARAAADLVKAGARNAVVTAGAAGAAYHGRGRSELTVPAFTVRAVDSVGAGDTFVGALAVALVAGVSPADAVTAAAAAGATAATRPGTQAGMPGPEDIRAVTGYQWPSGRAN
jgi:ribokinase